MRKPWTPYFLGIAKRVGEQSSCPRADVGAVFVDGSTKRIVSTGYSGSIPGAPHCEDVGCLMENGHCRRTVHAEINGLLYVRGQYDNLELYCTHKPCYQCLKALVTAKVKKVVYFKDYNDGLNDLIYKELPSGVITIERYIEP
jgi:dCMP deaminase